MPKYFPILVVDDDADDHLILEEYFRDIKAQGKVWYVDNGQLALDYLDHITNTQELPKLIVLDLNMPVLNGADTLIQLKKSERYKDIPVIIFSTSQNVIEKEKCLKYGAREFVVKPSSTDEGHEVALKFTSFV